MVGEALRGGPQALRRIDIVAVDVAYGSHVRLTGFRKVAGIVPAALAGADQADLYAVVGSIDARVRERGHRGCRAQKSPAGDTGFRHKEIIVRRANKWEVKLGC